jgi:hypothetical protein
MPSRPPNERVELLQGTLDMLILQTLVWGAQHGYGISQAIRAQSAEALQIETGSLYPALLGLAPVHAASGVSLGGRPHRIAAVR